MPKSLAGKLEGTKIPKQPKGPVWAGPESDADNGGITFSLLTKFLSCRERFRLRVIEGLKQVDSFSHHIEYGNMWHACEEALAANKPWERALTQYVQKLWVKYRTQQEQISHWHQVCALQFPLYINWWKKHPDVKDRTPLMQEEVFKVPYTLPSGRTVYLRGKFDSVDLIGKGKSAGIYLQENKTKGDIDEASLQHQLRFDLQTMLYLVALDESQTTMDLEREESVQTLFEKTKLAGVRYNVVRRPLSGGKGSIKRKEGGKNSPGESAADFYARLSDVIENAYGAEFDRREDQHYFFMRWKVEVSQQDIDKFKRECLDPILEQLCVWYLHVTSAVGKQNPFGPFFVGSTSESATGGEEYYPHWRHPYGSVNVVDEYGAQDVDNYMETGSETGLVRNAELFSELKEETDPEEDNKKEARKYAK